MNGNGTDVIRVSFEGGNLLGGVIVIDAELEVVRTADNPVLARNESTGTNRNIGKLECFDDGLRKECQFALLRERPFGARTYLCLVRPNVNMTAVECR